MSKIKRFDFSFLSKDEVIIFYGILVINITFLFYTRFYPSMDGPAHLYNSNLIKQLLVRNSFLGQFYQISTFPIPNWTSHFILTFLHFLFPGWLCEKLLIILYVTGMALSFRHLIKTLKPENVALSIFIFPFIYSFLFHLGFYNYSISFIFFFLTLSFWINNYKANQPSLYLYTGLFLIGTYLSNILTFAFLGITLGCTIFLFEAESNSLLSKKYIGSCLQRLLRLTTGSLPSLLLFIFFFQQVSFPAPQHQYQSSELIKWINDVRSLIVFSYQGEEVITGQFFHILVFLLLFSIVINENKARLRNMFLNARPTIAYFSVLVAFVLFFVWPDGSSAGMMSDRLSLMFFILFTILVITQTLPVKLQSVFTVIVIFLHLILLTKHTAIIHDLNRDAISINETARYIDENKVVLPVNLSDNWIQPHFSNYLGVDKPLVILENYELETNWFPVRWNANSPEIILGNRPSIDGLSWHQSGNTSKQLPIDYIFLYGNLSKIGDNNWKELNEIIDTEFILKYKSKDNYIELYQRKLEKP
ncbi:MAG TPA: hypothetical protein VGK10_19560 [Prolixibacteraceae bacterium]|jgi:hypothetical protein